MARAAALRRGKGTPPRLPRWGPRQQAHPLRLRQGYGGPPKPSAKAVVGFRAVVTGRSEAARPGRARRPTATLHRGGRLRQDAAIRDRASRVGMHRERAFGAGRHARARKATSGCRNFPGAARAVHPARIAQARHRDPEIAAPRGGFPALRSGSQARRQAPLAAQNRGLLRDHLAILRSDNLPNPDPPSPRSHNR